MNTGYFDVYLGGLKILVDIDKLDLNDYLNNLNDKLSKENQEILKNAVGCPMEHSLSDFLWSNDIPTPLNVTIDGEDYEVNVSQEWIWIRKEDSDENWRLQKSINRSRGESL